MKNKIILRDGLNHHKYAWPKTLLSYPVELMQEEDQASTFQMVDEKQREIPFQLYDIHGKPGGGTYANLIFTDNLPSGTEHSYVLEGVNAPVVLAHQVFIVKEDEGDHITLSTQVIYLKINKEAKSNVSGKYHIFTIGSGDEGIICNAYIHTAKEIDTYTVDLSANGCVFADCSIEARFADGSLYILKLRVIEGMEFVEMREEMTGFENQDRDKLTLEWCGFYPEKRYAGYREDEKIDQYNEEGGYLPFKLLPYSSFCSWWGTKAASFTDSRIGKSVGVFVRNVEGWEDGDYALWGSPETTAVRFRCDLTWDMETSLVWEYPLVYVSRCTAIAIYESGKNDTCEQKNYIEFLWYWYEFLNLNKVKDWILRWDEDKSAYPRFFPEESMPLLGMEVWHYGVRKQPFTPAFMEEIIYHLSHNMNQLYMAGPVAAREFFSWVSVFDMAAPLMTQQQFDDFKACCAFMAFAHRDENFMPIEKMLSGHPNFLADARSVPVLMASLFPGHPHSDKWVDQFEIAMARNMKYHIRPDVQSWNSKGGRWTENLGCYNWASLAPMMTTGALVYRTFGDNVLMYPNIIKWAEWMLNSLSAPVDGERTYSPQGAHSGSHQDPIIPTAPMRFLAERLVRYQPLLAEYLMHFCKQDTTGHEELIKGSNIFTNLYESSLKHNSGTRPYLQSAKFTGYGYILRSAVGEESEMSVHLQQIDEGPNYRWGRAGQGGCGVIYYNAAGKRYSYNRPEDIGDENMGDVQACCNFGVLVGHEYKSVGRNELSEPMYNFGFAQYAQVNAGEYAQPFYKSRSVIMSGNDYIVVYDQVGDMRVRGRFAWFVKEGEEFPHIDQLKPGARGVKVKPGIPADAAEELQHNQHESKGIVFDGSGDFLTVVTHRKLNCDYNVYVNKTEYGAEIKLQGRTDRIFRDAALIKHEDAKSCFTGYAGIIRFYGESRAEAALFKGTSIGVLGTKVTVRSLNEDSKAAAAGISFAVQGGRLTGKAVCNGAIQVKVQFSNNCETGGYRLYVNSSGYDVCPVGENAIAFTLPEGSHIWEWTDVNQVPQDLEIVKTVVSSRCVEVHWEKVMGATGYQVEISRDCGKSWAAPVPVHIATETGCMLTGLENGTKIHIRVQGFNEDCRGNWCHDYPIYITDEVPAAPEGLKVWKWGNAFKIIWGWQLGVASYKLYRRKKGTDHFNVVYEGSTCEFIDVEVEGKTEVYEYAASACNGNGEGGKSLLRDTERGGLAYWDPQPEKGFRRYNRSHEYGYNGFDHWSNALKSELQYPEL